jgi:hypothetical protein
MKQPGTRTNRIIVALAIVLSAVTTVSAQTSCKALRHVTIAAASIGLPTTGASVTSVSHRHDDGAGFCEVLGRIHPVDPAADDIRFELNLPDAWNSKALQLGGGTFDGYLAAAAGRGRTAVGLKSATPPLAEGYATLGSDGGHHRSYFPLPDAINAVNAKFARNKEMQRNFAGDALKKVHDAAVVLITQRYGHAPRHMYFIGGSTGGREALKVAQRFPDDYDGVLAAYAAWDQIELDLQFIRTAQALYAHGGYLGYSKTRLVQHAVLKACDAQDGLRDGIVSDPESCHVDPATLRCADGHAHYGCLSDAQLHTLETFATPQRTSTPVSDGVDSIPGYNVLSGASLATTLGILPFPLHNPVFLFNSFGYVIGSDVLRNFLTVGPHYDARNFDTTTSQPRSAETSYAPGGAGVWHAEVMQQALEVDATNADLAPFVAHGGKLILVHGTMDNIIPTNSSVDYYHRLQSTMGVGETAGFARLYIIPGLGHGFGKFDAGFDTVGVLDAWVDRGVAPRGLVVTDNHSGRTRPLCEYPEYARYVVGDPKVAGSFRCVRP